MVGGLKLDDRAADLAVAMAIASAAAKRKLSDDVVVFGEVGLGGEIRTVIQTERRISEAKKLGFSNVLAPRNSSKDSLVTSVRDLREALIKYLQ